MSFFIATRIVCLQSSNTREPSVYSVHEAVTYCSLAAVLRLTSGEKVDTQMWLGNYHLAVHEVERSVSALDLTRFLTELSTNQIFGKKLTSQKVNKVKKPSLTHPTRALAALFSRPLNFSSHGSSRSWRMRYRRVCLDTRSVWRANVYGLMPSPGFSRVFFFWLLLLLLCHTSRVYLHFVAGNDCTHRRCFLCTCSFEGIH